MTTHTYQTTIPHHEWDEAVVTIEQVPHNPEPTVGIKVSTIQGVFDCVTLTKSEFFSIYDIFMRYIEANETMRYGPK